MKAVSVIIPAYNEEKTIGQVIDIVKQSNIDCEVIVVNNCCTDNTTQIATDKGARVVYSDKKGKGYAMEEGLKVAQNEIVVFLDADITDYNKNLIHLLVNPIIEHDIDFVKSTFERTKGGLVTEIATKPLLNILFPEMYQFSEPLSGMIASKKSILEKLEFEKDYGVDIGIILDIANLKLTTAEVNIGKIENMSHLLKTTQSMQNMSNQIMRAILKRAKYVK
ncbi:MAG: glycosyltransferase [Clostridia bacterium]|nr:glycosyltransferase [Clostridia bacterium]